MEALSNLGVDWRLFLAQAVNFLILLFILQRYAYKPMLKFLEERSTKIEQGLKDAEAATKRLEETEQEQKNVLSKAQKEARAIVEEAVAVAKRRDQEQLEKTKTEIAQMLEASQKNIAEEKERMLREAKAELGSLVVSATEKIAKVKLDASKDNELIRESVS